ncbi:MAG: hypothetical protein WC726_01840 [Parcubacteria group bacterium]|jgi:hypothetical protein
MNNFETEDPPKYKSEPVQEKHINAVKNYIGLLLEDIEETSQHLLRKKNLTNVELEGILDDLQEEIGRLNFGINNIRKKIVNSRKK